MRRHAVIAATLLLAGCGSEGGSTVAQPAADVSHSASSPTPDETGVSPAPPEESATPEATSETPRTAVPATLQFRAETVEGRPFSGASLAGKPVVLWFWAPWCPTCRSQIPQVQDLAARYGDRVGVVGVGSLDDRSAIEAFADDVPEPTQLADVDGSVWRHFGVIEQSSFVLLDAKGAVVLEAGYGGADDLADQVAALVG